MFAECEDYSCTHKRQMIQSISENGTKIFFPRNFEKTEDFFFYRDGRERVSKAIDLVSRSGSSHLWFLNM
jgi:hypothetical protein